MASETSHAHLDRAVRDSYTGDYLSSLDLIAAGKDFADLTIERVAAPGTVRDAAGKTIDEPVIYFGETPRGLVANTTNLRAIALQHGSAASKWSGKRIRIGVRLVDAFGQQVPALRVLPPDGIPVPHAIRKQLGKPLPKREETPA